MHTLTPYVLLMFVHDNRLLLLKRGFVSFASGCYSLVGGKVEQGETFRQAAIREAFEEIGVIIAEEDLRFIHAFHRKGSGEELVAFIFQVLKWEGVPFNKEPDKHAQMQWFPLDVLPEDVIPATRQALECIKSGVTYSEHGWLT